MTFDVDILVEDVLSVFIRPDILSFDPRYFSLETATTYLKYGFIFLSSSGCSDIGLNKTQLLWINPYFRLVFSPKRITINLFSSLYPVVFMQDLISMQDWQKFLEQEMPKFVKIKT